MTTDAPMHVRLAVYDAAPPEGTVTAARDRLADAADHYARVIGCYRAFNACEHTAAELTDLAADVDRAASRLVALVLITACAKDDE